MAVDTMRRFISALLALSLAAAAGCAPRPPAGLPREPATLPLPYGGVYRSEDLEMEIINERIFPMRHFLRFYPDGRVIQVGTTGEMELDVFKAENGYYGGTFTIRDSLLSFSIPDHRGQVDYRGEIRGGRLHLRIHVIADGRRSEGVYAFRRGAGLPPPPGPADDG